MSIATVSRVMNGSNSVSEHLQSRVLEAAKACNYGPSNVKRGNDRIALLYTGDFYLGSPYDSACFEGMSRAMRRSSYDLVLLDMQRDRGESESLKQFFTRKGVCGAVVRSAYEHRKMTAEMADEGLPLVVIGDHFDHQPKNLPFVYADSKTASGEAVEYLVSLGHRKIAFASCERDDGDHIDRLDAYRNVLESEGIFDPKYVYRVPPFRLDAAPLARRMLSRADRPTAIYVADPMISAGVLYEAHRMGVRVPEDFSIIGLDDTDLRNVVYPRMTAVCQDSALIGERAFELLRDMIESKADGEKLFKPHDAWFEIHETTGPPPTTVKTFVPTGVGVPIGN